MRKVVISWLISCVFSYALLAQPIRVPARKVARIVKTLSADNMKGRKVFTPGIDKAATYIQKEFAKAGLKFFPGLTSFEQNFNVFEVVPVSSTVLLDNQILSEESYFILTDQEKVFWNNNNPMPPVLSHISASDNFPQKLKQAITLKKSGVILIDPAHTDLFMKYKNHFSRNNTRLSLDTVTQVFAISTNPQFKAIEVNVQNQRIKKQLKNVVGYLPGQSRENEYVIFSAHYDHLGAINPINGDSIANGADDDASGTTAVLALAQYYSKLKKNERSLLFVAFTAEEVGGYGSQFFSKQLNPDNISAMLNIEMIGKRSQFGEKAGFITGFDKSNLGTILQKNLAGSEYALHPDPYIKENLFYRSDNATLARLGVPAHTLSTDKIDTDSLYHSVNDEFASLDIRNMTHFIKSIVRASGSIIAGKDTPTRIKPEEVAD